MLSDKLPKKFFCFELEEGAIFIGYLYIFLCISSIIATITAFFMDWSTLLKSLFAILTILAVVLLPLYVALIFGTMKESRKFLLPWLFLHGLWLILGSFLVLIFNVLVIVYVFSDDPIIVSTSDGETEFQVTAGGAALFGVLSFAIQIFLSYTYLTVFALYRKYRDGNEVDNVVTTKYESKN